jgi:hypothetical protein
MKALILGTLVTCECRVLWPGSLATEGLLRSEVLVVLMKNRTWRYIADFELKTRVASSLGPNPTI